MVKTILGVGAAVGAIIKKDLVVGFIKYLVKAAIAKLPAATVAGTKIIAGLTSPIGLGVIVGAALLYIIYYVCKGPKIRKKLKMLEGVFNAFIKNFMPRITNPITARRELTRGVSKLPFRRKKEGGYMSKRKRTSRKNIKRKKNRKTSRKNIKRKMNRKTSRKNIKRTCRGS